MEALREMVGCGEWCFSNDGSGCVFEVRVMEDLFRVWLGGGLDGMVEYCVRNVPWGCCDIMKVLELLNDYWGGRITDEEFRDRFEGCFVEP